MIIDVGVQRVTVGDVDLAYTAAGDPADPPVLLVAGLGAQLIRWADGVCQALTAREFYVIRFDNRDAGLSTHLGTGTDLAYGLTDLAGDAAGLIDALGLGSSHLVGVSMGGMIAQLLTIEHPGRVRSLTSIMSTTGDPEVGEASDAATALLTAPPAATREAVIEGAVLSNRVMGSPSYPTAPDEVRARAARAFDRAYDPAGFGRQLQACLTTPDRTPVAHRRAASSSLPRRHRGLGTGSRCPRRTGERPWTGSNVSNRDSRMPSPPVRSGSCSWSSWSREETRRTSSWLRSSPVVWDTTSAPHRMTTRWTAAVASLGISITTRSTGSQTTVRARRRACRSTIGAN